MPRPSWTPPGHRRRPCQKCFSKPFDGFQDFPAAILQSDTCTENRRRACHGYIGRGVAAHRGLRPGSIQDSARWRTTTVHSEGAPQAIEFVESAVVCRRTRCQSGHPAGRLWPQQDAWLARRALNTTVYRLRQLLRHKDALTLDDDRVSLDPHLCWVDAWTFEQAAVQVREPAVLLRALRLYSGPFLGDTDHPLAFEVRDRLRRKFVQAVLRVGQSYESLSDLGAAIEVYQIALDADCTAEDVHQALMRCLLRQGKPAAVAAAYQRCRTILRRYLATVPSPGTEQVYREACST